MGKSTFTGPIISKTRHEQYYTAFYDDFLGGGALVIPAAGSAENGVPWTKKIVGAAPPTVAGVANAAQGVMACTLTSANQKQDAAFYWDDQKNVDISLMGGYWKSRIKLNVIPTGVANMYTGLFSNWGDGPDAMTYGIFFQCNASGLLYANCDDNATDSQVSTGITLVTTDWAELAIDFTDFANIKFYVGLNGAALSRVADSTTYNFTATGANAILQSFQSMYKASGTGVGTLYTDYVKIWGRRI